MEEARLRRSSDVLVKQNSTAHFGAHSPMKIRIDSLARSYLGKDSVDLQVYLQGTSTKDKDGDDSVPDHGLYFPFSAVAD